MTERPAQADPTKLSYNRLYQPPFLGLIAFAGVILWKPVAHSISVLLDNTLPGASGYLAGGLIGLTGAVIVWKGLRRDEHAATCMGFLGGVMIWLGWFEYAFKFFADYMEVRPLINEAGRQAISPNLLVLQSTAIPVLTLLFLILIANRETRCRLAMWLRRNLGLQAGVPTPRYRRNYARITALEVIFINWFMYLINITLNDVRIFGTGHPAQFVVFVAFIIWVGYLLIFKLPGIRAMPLAIRYAIGVGGPAWSAVEIASRLDLYTEIWIYPLRYPISMIAITGIFVLTAIAVYLTPNFVVAPSHS